MDIDKKGLNNEVLREFGITTFAIKNRTSVYIFTLLMCIMGVIAYLGMPRESYPEIVQPTIIVSLVYPGNSPKDIENLVTRPVEKQINTINGIKKLSSTSMQDYTIIIVEFEADKNVDKALQEVKDKVDKSKNDLPSDLDKEPTITQVDFSQFPILNINLSGDYSNDQLREYSKYLKDRLEKIPEISEVEIKGLLDKEVVIKCDPDKMQTLNVGFYDIDQTMQQENVTMSGGDLLSDGTRRNVRVVGQFSNLDQIRNLIVRRDNGNIVYLRDFATVEFTQADRDSYARMDGKPVVTLEVKKQGGKNMVTAVAQVDTILDEVRKTKLPKDLKVVITGDMSKQTEHMVNELANHILLGVILVTLVILFFLGLQNALFVGIAIPVSMLIGFAILNWMGITLNMMVLFSLILVLGMLVDDGIVVIENIYRLHSKGMELKDAAKYGTGEVAFSVISSTLTTLAAFVPLLFWKSTMGAFMKFLPLTMMFTMTASLFVAMVVNPALASQFLKIETEKKTYNEKRFWIVVVIFVVLGTVMSIIGHSKHVPMMVGFGSFSIIIAALFILNRYVLDRAAHWFQNHLLVRFEHAYASFIASSLKGRRPLYIFFGIIFLMVGSIAFYFGSNPKIIFFPEGDPKYVNVFIEMPIGTDIEETYRMTQLVEKEVTDVLKPNRDVVEAVLAQVGKGTADQMSGPGSNIGVSPQKSRLIITFVEFQQRHGVSTAKIMEDIRDRVKRIPGAIISVGKDPTGPPVGYPVNIEVSGDDYETLVQVSEQVKKHLSDMNVAGVEQLKSDVQSGKPEMLVSVNRDAARRYGISTIQVAAEIRTALYGRELSKYKEGEDDYPIVARFTDEKRYDLQTLMNKKITFQHPQLGIWLGVPMSDVITVDYTSGYGSIKRLDLNRVITIYSNIKKGYSATEILDQYKRELSNIKLPDGYTVSITGESQEQAATMAFMQKAMLIAVFLIFLIIITQFNSLQWPFIILFTVVLSTIGVFLGLGIFRMEFVALMTSIGIIALAGVVVKNAIVLIDFSELLKQRKRVELGLREGSPLTIDTLREIYEETGRTRLRPVILTALTAVLGLIPLAIGLNFNFFTLFTEYNPQIYFGGDSVAFWSPLAWTVIFGLTFATFLTLVVLPSLCLLVDITIHKIKGQK
jgi:multidrug efflux pump subunit AcrB